MLLNWVTSSTNISSSDIRKGALHESHGLRLFLVGAAEFDVQTRIERSGPVARSECPLTTLVGQHTIHHVGADKLDRDAVDDAEWHPHSAPVID